MPKNLDNWARLASAAFDAKTELARLIPRIDAALAAGDTSVLRDVREIAVRHACALQAAIKRPATIRR